LTKLTFRRAVGVGATVLATTGGLYASALPTASATTAATPETYLTMVGSNTTQEVMGAITTKFNASTTAKDEHAKLTNVYAQPADPGTVAPSDANCNGGVAITYIQESNPGTNQRTAPNGSGAGKTALATSVTNGDSCTSIARSSSPGASTDPSGTEAYAYAVDGVTWATSANSAAPSNLSIIQLENIYDCKVTNWDKVGGKNAPIERYFPQSGSGTGSFFASVLGFDPRVIGGVNTCSTPATQIEENEATSITSDVPDAVMIYSGGAWAAQANGVDPDARNGFVLDTINGKANILTETDGKYKPSSIVTEKNVEPAAYEPKAVGVVQGIRNLFNFINTNSVDYAAAASAVGANSQLCTDKDPGVIETYGFAPLSKCVEQF
jgi:ABC-type phosphate transport system substrate-binding protein